MQHSRLLCPSLCPWVCSNSCPLSQWSHPTISSSVTLFSSCPQYFQHQGLFQWVSSSHQVAKASWNSLAFSVIQRMLAIWSLVPLPFLNPAGTSGSSPLTYCWSLACMIWSISCWHVKWVQLHGNLNSFWHCLSLGLEWNLTFSTPWPLLSFQICWHNEYRTLTASSFKIWNSSAGIPSPLLALFIVMLPKAHLHTPGCLALGEWPHHCG